MNFLSLFAGIGGFDLGLERAGMTCVGQVEIDEFCQRVLRKHWPDVPRHDDVRTAVAWWRSFPRASVPVQVSAGSLGAPHRRPRVFVVANADGEGEPLRSIHAEVAGLRPVPRRGRGNWRKPFPGPVRVDDGVRAGLDGARNRALGNAVVPQVAEYVGRLVMAADSGRAA